MSYSSGLASSSASSSGGSSGSFSTGFMNLPPTHFQGFDDGYVRLGYVPPESFALRRNRFRPIMTFNNPADFVGGPQNTGGAQLTGGGSLATADKGRGGGTMGSV